MNHFYFAFDRGANLLCIAVSMSMCLSVCLSVLSVCPPARLLGKSRVQISPNFLYILTTAVARSSSDSNAMYYRFFDDVMFSHNEANGPESTTMRLIRRVRQDAASGAKSALSDRVLLILRWH